MTWRARRWPLLVIGTAASVAIWSGWVGLGRMCGFGVVHPLPGIVAGFRLNAAITLPVGVEAYGAYALGAWLMLDQHHPARIFARRSAIGSLGLGMLGQVAFHLLVAAHAVRAPWPVVVAVSCLPVVTLGFAAALTHLLRSAPGLDADVADAAVSTAEALAAALGAWAATLGAWAAELSVMPAAPAPAPYVATVVADVPAVQTPATGDPALDRLAAWLTLDEPPARLALPAAAPVRNWPVLAHGRPGLPIVGRPVPEPSRARAAALTPDAPDAAHAPASGGAPRVQARTAPGVQPEARRGTHPARTRGRIRGPVSDADAEAHFAADLAAGQTPSARRIQREMHVGQDRATALRRHLELATTTAGSTR